MDKPEESKGQEKQNKCLSCGATSATRQLVHLEVKGEEQWVCVRCLPMLIHG